MIRHHSENHANRHPTHSSACAIARLPLPRSSDRLSACSTGSAGSTLLLTAATAGFSATRARWYEAARVRNSAFVSFVCECDSLRAGVGWSDGDCDCGCTDSLLLGEVGKDGIAIAAPPTEPRRRPKYTSVANHYSCDSVAPHDRASALCVTPTGERASGSPAAVGRLPALSLMGKKID